MAIFKENTESECVSKRHPFVWAIILRILRDNCKTVRDRIQLIFTDMKSHTGFRFISKLVTLNDIERRKIKADTHAISAVAELLVSPLIASFCTVMKIQ